jgi:NAD(P)-dependent dehydrogenase (short-subunit alcohol dehydrogenase family)
VEALGRSLVRSFALEYAPDARVNFVVGGAHPARREGRHSRLPARRNTTPEDLVHAALFLGGDGALFITGETLPVDGGAHLLWTAGGEG